MVLLCMGWSCLKLCGDTLCMVAVSAVIGHRLFSCSGLRGSSAIMSKLLCYRWERGFCWASAVDTPPPNPSGSFSWWSVCAQNLHIWQAPVQPQSGDTLWRGHSEAWNGIAWIPTGISHFSCHSCPFWGPPSPWASCSQLRRSPGAAGGRGRKRREAR